jgi:hypothetical protein
VSAEPIKDVENFIVERLVTAPVVFDNRGVKLFKHVFVEEL